MPNTNATGTGTHTGASGQLTAGYYANDMAASVSQGTGAGAESVAFGLDPVQNRFVSQTSTRGATGAIITTAVTNHFDDNGDSPAWAETTLTPPTGAATTSWTANIPGPDGDLAAMVTGTGTGTTANVALPIVNLHGDVCATVPGTGVPTAITGYSETTEYGTPRIAAAALAPYGWVGSKQRAADIPGGLILMGVRLYNPATGRFLSVDPIAGGNANAYTYPNDPINGYDLDGMICDSESTGACSLPKPRSRKVKTKKSVKKSKKANSSSLIGPAGPVGPPKHHGKDKSQGKAKSKRSKKKSSIGGKMAKGCAGGAAFGAVGAASSNITGDPLANAKATVGVGGACMMGSVIAILGW